MLFTTYECILWEHGGHTVLHTFDPLQWGYLILGSSEAICLRTHVFSFLPQEYLTQVDLEEERECQESKAWEEFDKGEEKATTVLQLLKKLDRPDQFPLYYCGGLKLLSHAITDCEYAVGSFPIPPNLVWVCVNVHYPNPPHPILWARRMSMDAPSGQGRTALTGGFLLFMVLVVEMQFIYCYCRNVKLLGDQITAQI